jgi:hypothetical protein
MNASSSNYKEFEKYCRKNNDCCRGFGDSDINSKLGKYFIDWCPYQKKFLYNTSSIIIPFAKKLVQIINIGVFNRVAFVLPYIINEAVVVGSGLKSEEVYVKYVLHYFSQKCIEFDEFVVANKMGGENKLLRDYFINCFVILMGMNIGKIKNFELYDYITRLWVIVESGRGGRGGSGGWWDECARFFAGETVAGFSKRNVVGKCIAGIKKNCDAGVYKKIIRRLRWMFARFYGEGSGEFGGSAVERNFTKSKEAMNIYIYALDIDQWKIDVIEGKRQDDEFMKIYEETCCAIKLIDDLSDMRVDRERGKPNIVNASEYRMGIANYVIDTFDKYGELSKHFIMICMTMILHYQQKEISEDLDVKCDFINLGKFNFNNTMDLLLNRDFLLKCFKIYATHNILIS